MQALRKPTPFRANVWTFSGKGMKHRVTTTGFCPMARLLVLEDNLKDIGIATDMALRAGFSDVQTHSSSSMSEVILGNAIEDGKPLPDAMILDLDLGLESGFELLRFCHKNRLIPRIPVVVWTVMGEKEREICQLFEVQEVVAKHEGPSALCEALVRINPLQESQASVG